MENDAQTWLDVLCPGLFFQSLSCYAISAFLCLSLLSVELDVLFLPQNTGVLGLSYHLLLCASKNVTQNAIACQHSSCSSPEVFCFLCFKLFSCNMKYVAWSSSGEHDPTLCILCQS